jgi:glycosyltransferase involved in cell wall biosynthesis
VSRVLIVSGDVVNDNMGGVGIRSWELAQALAKACQVTLAVPNENTLSSTSVKLVAFDWTAGDLRPLAREADVILIQGFTLHFHPYLRELGIPLVVDLYVPYLLESLVWHVDDDWQTWKPAYEEYLRVQLELLRAGDFFICASERQRDYWLGWLNAQKRLNPHTYRHDPTFRMLIDCVAFGLPSTPPKQNRPVLKGILPGIAAGDRVILWSGGLWDWLDPLTLIRAVAGLVPTHPELKLYFMGTRHPNPIVSGMTMPDRAINLARELDLYEQSVFFGEWVPYDDRANYLLEADLAVVSHPGHIETHFSFRTRVLDCIWAGIPLIITEGDAMADWVRSHDLGLTVPAQDVQSLAKAIEKMLSLGDRRVFDHRFDTLRESLCWDKVIGPLELFCLQPSLAPDKGLYLTETERVGKDKDTFLAQVIKDKDTFLAQVIKDKDAAIEPIIQDRARLQQTLDRYHRWLPFRAYLALKRWLGRP